MRTFFADSLPPQQCIRKKMNKEKNPKKKEFDERNSHKNVPQNMKSFF
jgi:hypothetical protein